jgi:hypothetical protein
MLACVLSPSRVEDTIAGLCSARSALLCSPLPHLSSRVILEISFRKRLAAPCLAGSGFAPFVGPPSPSVTIVCSLVLPRARSSPSSYSITTAPSSPTTPIPPRRQHQHLSSPPSTVHQSTVAGRHSFLSALFFSSSTCAGLSATRYCRCWRHRHPPSAQRQSTRELLL